MISRRTGGCAGGLILLVLWAALPAWASFDANAPDQAADIIHQRAQQQEEYANRDLNPVPEITPVIKVEVVKRAEIDPASLVVESTRELTREQLDDMLADDSTRSEPMLAEVKGEAPPAPPPPPSGSPLHIFMRQSLFVLLAGGLLFGWVYLRRLERTGAERKKKNPVTKRWDL